VANFSATSDAQGDVEIVDPVVPNGGSIEPAAAVSFPRGSIDLPNVPSARRRRSPTLFGVGRGASLTPQ
jgi:hypothetical protein